MVWALDQKGFLLIAELTISFKIALKVRSVMGVDTVKAHMSIGRAFVRMGFCDFITT